MKHLIANLKSSFDGHPWYGTSFMNIIDKVHFDQINLIPANGSNSIVRLVSHVIAWRGFVIEKLQGNADYDIVLNTPEDWPMREVKTEGDWTALVAELQATQKSLIQLLENLSADIDLDILVPGKEKYLEYNYYYMISGLIQHDTYHLGQLALTWKLF